jgi:hypothetical protein
MRHERPGGEGARLRKGQVSTTTHVPHNMDKQQAPCMAGYVYLRERGCSCYPANPIQNKHGKITSQQPAAKPHALLVLYLRLLLVAVIHSLVEAGLELRCIGGCLVQLQNEVGGRGRNNSAAVRV